MNSLFSYYQIAYKIDKLLQNYSILLSDFEDIILNIECVNKSGKFTNDIQYLKQVSNKLKFIRDQIREL